VITLWVDIPGPRILAVLLSAVFVPLGVILVSLVRRLRAWRRGELSVTPLDPHPGTGLLAQLSQMRWFIASVLMFAAWPGFYFLASLLVGQFREPVVFHFEVDARMPFRTEFAMIYSGIYWFFIFPLLYGQGRALFWPLLGAYAAIMVTCSTFFIFYPVEYPRDPLVIRHLGDYTLAIIHRADPPINCFPSSHCAVAILSALGLRHVNPRAAIPGAVVAGAICLATLLTHQHYLVDTVAGIALGAGAYVVFLRPEFLAKVRNRMTARP
jgi:membrane-associated phospholipid phosphatase